MSGNVKLRIVTTMLGILEGNMFAAVCTYEREGKGMGVGWDWRSWTLLERGWSYSLLRLLTQSKTLPLSRLTSRAGSFRYVFLQSSKAPATENPSTSCRQPSSSASYPPSRVDNATILAQQKSSFRVHSGTWFLTKPSSLSNVSPLSINSIVLQALGYPWLTPATTTSPPSHVNLSLDVTTGVLERSALTDIRAANRLSYFAATAATSRSSTQSSGGWNDQDHSPRIVIQAPLKEGGRRRVILVEAILCLVLLNLLIENRRFLGQS